MKLTYDGPHDEVEVLSPFTGELVARVKRGESAQIPDDIAERLSDDWSGRGYTSATVAAAAAATAVSEASRARDAEQEAASTAAQEKAAQQAADAAAAADAARVEEIKAAQAAATRQQADLENGAQLAPDPGPVDEPSTPIEPDPVGKEK